VFKVYNVDYNVIIGWGKFVGILRGRKGSGPNMIGFAFEW